ncbi:hypothetical protein KR100_06390 [Synechococcus sp. KORDI-100]|nr:hypothetical protein KR100_06390 [Synechococcus sp. KORDI-100]
MDIAGTLLDTPSKPEKRCRHQGIPNCALRIGDVDSYGGIKKTKTRASQWQRTGLQTPRKSLFASIRFSA